LSGNHPQQTIVAAWSSVLLSGKNITEVTSTCTFAFMKFWQAPAPPHLTLSPRAAAALCRAWAPPAGLPRPPLVLLSSRRRQRHCRAKLRGAAAVVSLGRRLVGGGGVCPGHLLRRYSGPRWPRTLATPGGQWWWRWAQAGPIWAPMGLDGSCPDLLDPDDIPGSSWVPLAA
jgi:hypothetical protein